MVARNREHCLIKYILLLLSSYQPSGGAQSSPGITTCAHTTQISPTGGNDNFAGWILWHQIPTEVPPLPKVCPPWVLPLKSPGISQSLQPRSLHENNVMLSNRSAIVYVTLWSIIFLLLLLITSPKR